MGRVVPNTTIKLYQNVQIDADDKEQLMFFNAEAREGYFNTKLVRTVENCTTVKKQFNVVRMEVPGSVISKCNYLSFINPSFDNKIFYCKIIDYNYINNECYEVLFEEDSWITWMFDAKFDPCYVDREGLTESEYTAAQNNPYDPSLIKLRTAEDLPVGHDVEKTTYTYGQLDDYFSGEHDGYEVFRVMSPANTYIMNKKTISMITLGPIDWGNFGDVLIKGPDGVKASPWALIGNIRISLKESSNLAMYKLGDLTQGELKVLTPLTWQMSIGLSAYIAHTQGDPATAHHITDFSVPTETYVFENSEFDYYGPNKTTYKFEPLKFIIDMCTKLGIESSILSSYEVPVYYIDNMLKHDYYSNLNAVPILTSKEVYNKKNIEVNPKLLLYPYSYVRVETPSDTKEYRYEDFIASQEDNPDWHYTEIRRRFNDQAGKTYTEKFNLGYPIVNTDNGITLSFTPAGYKTLGAANDRNTAANMNESIRFSNIPTRPMMIDGWVSQCAANALQQINSRTTESLYDFGRAQRAIQEGGVGWLGKMASTMAGVTGYNGVGALESLKNIPGLAFGAANLQLEQDAFNNKVAMSDQAAAALGGATIGNAVYENFQYTKPAYAANKYTPANGGTDLYEKQATFDFLLTHVQLNPAFIDIYNRYFANYGYNCGFYKIPAVLQYMMTVTTTDQVHWDNDNGNNISYVKTTHAHVTGVPKYVSSHIEAMLDGGVRFIKK